MIFGMLRVKNEARWICQVVAAILPICKEVLILDDHSTDDTAAICRTMGCIVYDSPFDDLHETRDKEYLLEKVWTLGATVGDYCLMIDGDEELYEADVPLVRDIANAGSLICGSLKVLYLWDSVHQIRVDRWYAEVRRASLFKLTHRNLSFQRTGFGGNLHCGSVPIQLMDRIVPLPIRLLHYGYLHKEDRIRKFHWYNKIDPENEFEDAYRHMVIGDIFPADSSFKWAGPLRVVQL